MYRGTKIGRGLLPALLIACAALVLPGSAAAATVGVEELETEPRQARLVFAGGAGEANDLTVTVAGEEGPFYDIRLLDTTASVTPGAGCTGGGAPGVAVHCRVRKPTPGDNIECFKGCRYTPGTKWELELAFELGGAGSRLDTTALPADALDPQHPWRGHVWSPIRVTVTPGAGSDTVLTGPGPDLIEASPGADLIRTGGGGDTFEGGPSPDGPDQVDFGGDDGRIDYSERGDGVRYDPNGLADDGGAGEGDNLDVASEVETGAGDDTLVAAESRGTSLYGGAGDDRLHGRSGGETLRGGEGDDELFGAEGDDYLLDPTYGGRGGNSGNDTASGGAGEDEIRLGGGDDEASGGAGEDRIAVGPGDDRAAGDAGGDEIELGPGRDDGAGGAGGDLLFGEQGADAIDGEQGADRISGDVGPDVLFGGAGDDRIAAGMSVVDERELSGFLDSTGPLEGKPDRVDCGDGSRDGAKIGRGDAATRCESTPRAQLLEIQALEQSDGERPPHLRCLIRRAGRIELTSKGLQRKERMSTRDYDAWGAPLWPVGRALTTLLRTGQVTVRLKITFHAAGGRDVVRTRTVRLFLPGGIYSRRRVQSAWTRSGR